MAKPDVDDVMLAYIKLRDKKEEIKTRHTAELAPINNRMEKMEGWLQRKLNHDGLQNYKGKSGLTAYLKKRTSVKTQDWQAALRFVVKNRAWQFLDAKLNKTQVQDYMDEHGEPPPGIEVRVEEVCQVRR